MICADEHQGYEQAKGAFVTLIAIAVIYSMVRFWKWMDRVLNED